ATQPCDPGTTRGRPPQLFGLFASRDCGAALACPRSLRPTRNRASARSQLALNLASGRHTKHGHSRHSADRSAAAAYIHGWAKQKLLVKKSVALCRTRDVLTLQPS